MPRAHPLTNLAFPLVVLLAACPTGGAAAGVEAHAHDLTTASEGRYTCRYGVEVPDDARFPSIEAFRSGGTTVFDPQISALVAAMSSVSFAQRVGQLSGEFSAQVGGECVTFTTRYSLGPQAELSWQFALEVLEAAGWDVAYHDYTRSGNALKNIVATKLGTTTPEQVYVMGGHIDSISPQANTLAPGAEDNATGTTCVLLAASALAGYDFESTIELVLFSGEEQGLWGSQAYVSDALAAGRDIRAAVTFDMTGYFNQNRGVLIEGESAWISLMTVMGDAVTAFTDIDQEFSFFSFGSDHVPFQDANIPAILAIDLDWDVYPGYHRTTDVYANVRPAFGVQIARAGVATVAHLAGIVSPTVAVPDFTPPVQLAIHPNPASSTLTIIVDAGDDEDVRIFDLEGRLVRRLDAPSGHSRLGWDLVDGDGHRVPAGVYFVRVGDRSERLVTLR